MLTKVQIDGIDVTSKCVSYQYERTFGDLLSEINLRFVRGINDLVTLNNGLRIEVWRGWVTSTDEKIFDGYIEKYEPEGGIITITGIDKLWDLVRKEVTHMYDSSVDSSAGKISLIFKDLVTTYGGLTADGTSVQDSGTTYLINKFVCNHADPFERCKKLADAIDWQFYYKANTDKVYFEPKGYTANANVLSVGTNIISMPKWNYDITEMANNITFVGAYQEIETTQLGQIGVTSGFTTSGITIAYEPISVKVYGGVANPPTTLKTGGVPDSTTTFDYYVDKVKKQILPKSGTSFTANDYYEIRYSFAAPIPINMYSQSSITTYGEFKKTVTLKDVRSVADAEVRGTKYLEKYSTPFIFTTLKVRPSADLDLDVGQNINVIDNLSTPTVNKIFTINKYRIRYPADYDEIDVGDKYWRLADFQSMIMEKLKRVEEEEFTNTDMLNQLINMDNSSIPINVKSRYLRVQRDAIAGTGIFLLGDDELALMGTQKLGDSASAFILDSSTYGVLDTSPLGDGGIISDTDFRVIWPDNLYIETFFDTDFKDASTTATWNTTTKTVTF